MPEQEEMTKKIITEVLSQINKTLYGIALGLLTLLLILAVPIIMAFSAHGENITKNTETNRLQEASIKNLNDDKANKEVVDIVLQALIRIEDKLNEK